MRPVIRPLLLAASLALSALPATGAAALAAGDNATAYPYAIDVEWCWPSAEDPTYCFTIDGHLAFIDSPGAALATGTLRTHTMAYEDGQIVSESWHQLVDQWRASRDGDQYVLVVEHSRFVSGTEQCVATSVLRLVDYQVVLDHAMVSCT